MLYENANGLPDCRESHAESTDLPPNHLQEGRQIHRIAAWWSAWNVLFRGETTKKTEQKLRP